MTNKKTFKVKGYTMKIVVSKSKKPMKVEIETLVEKGKAQIQMYNPGKKGGYLNLRLPIIVQTVPSSANYSAVLLIVKLGITIHVVSEKKGGTVLITRHSGDSFLFVKIVAYKIIRPLFIILMNGVKGESVVEEMTSTLGTNTKDAKSKCNICQKSFKNSQRLSIHATKMHGENKIHPAAVKRTRHGNSGNSIPSGIISKKTALDYNCNLCNLFNANALEQPYKDMWSKPDFEGV